MKTTALGAVRRVARKLDPEPSHAFQVCRNALDLFDATRALHRLGGPARRLLEAAALLHDIGHTIEMFRHHKHSRDLILKMELPGVSAREQRIVACIARYHRKAHPSLSHSLFADLRKPDQQCVLALSAILRIADGLDRSHAASCRRIRADRAGSLLSITIDQRQPNAADIWGAQRKQGLFEEVFRVKVAIAPSTDAGPRNRITKPIERRAHGNT